jgi:hypothetical protein
MLVKRNPDILSYKKDFEEYKQRVEQWKSGIKTGVKTEEEYFEWLQTIKGKRK